MTDREWNVLVSDLRDTFGARGRVTIEGENREWRNSNLYVTVEPTETGFRFRIGSRKGNATMQNRLGALGLGMGWVLAAVALLPGDPLFLDVLPPAVILTSLGGGALVLNALGLPRWVKEREQQMNYIVSRVSDLTKDPPA
jgi:hypothetical protein